MNRMSGDPRLRYQRPGRAKAYPVIGSLTHDRNYFVGLTIHGETVMKCHICSGKYSFFSIAVDSSGTEHRCCLRCLLKLGGIEQLQGAMQGQYGAYTSQVDRKSTRLNSSHL